MLGENKMKKKIIIFMAVCILFNTPNIFSQPEDNSKYKINPTEDTKSLTGVYIPKNLEDCFVELKKMLHPELIKEMKSGLEKGMNKYHRGLGMWMRNNWGLWSESQLSKYFKKLGIHHPDDMSGIILDSFWRHLNNQSLELKNQVQYYKEYWEKLKSKKENL